MVLLELIIFAETQNIEKIVIPEHYEWHFKIRCSQCSTNFDNQIYFTENDKVEVKVEGSSANFQAKCKNCKRSGNITLIKKQQVLADPNNGKIKSVLASFDCRGVDLVEFVPQDSLSAVAAQSGLVFKNIDTTDLWVEYDQNQSRNVQIENVKFEFKRTK